MISPLPGGIDDTAPQRDPYFGGRTDQQLLDDAARIQAEIQRRAEAAKKPQFPLTWDEFQLYCTRDDRGTDADGLNLEGDCARNFSYAGLGLTFRVIIQENGDTVATHVLQNKTDQWIALERPLRLN